MRFFIMKQDVALPYCISYRDFDIRRGTHIFKKKDAKRLNDSSTLYLTGNGDEVSPDFIQHPVYMVSEQIKGIMDAYEEGLIFKQVVLIHKEASRQFMYYQIIMDELDVRSDKMEYYPNGLYKKLILDSDKLKEHHIFMLKDCRMAHPLISLEVLESLLRRNAVGVCFEEVEVI